MSNAKLDRRKKQDTTFVSVQKGTKVQLNKEWLRVNAAWATPKSIPVLRHKGIVTGFATTRNCVRVQFEGNKTSQTFHIGYLDVL